MAFGNLGAEPATYESDPGIPLVIPPPLLSKLLSIPNAVAISASCNKLNALAFSAPIVAIA